jgi:transglutaminase-like putative cysteine protease
VRHETRYRYASPVSVAQHQAHLKPLADSHQSLEEFALEIEPPPAHRSDSVDAMGNAQVHFSVAQLHGQLRVLATSRVRVSARFEGLVPEASPAWEPLAASLRYVAGATYEPAVEFALPSPYVPRLPALRAYALPSFAPGVPVAAGALNLMQRLHTDFVYQSASTAVDTPLAQVLEQRRGVCQDFAHLLIGCLRMLGLPARYVSGYLLTHPPGAAPAGGAAMLGADASHAWMQVWCPGTPGVPTEGSGAGWLSLDPTNNLVPGQGHVRVAIGRDYGDVTPLRGVIRGGGRHELSVGVSTRLIHDEPGASGVPGSPGASGTLGTLGAPGLARPLHQA